MSKEFTREWYETYERKRLVDRLGAQEPQRDARPALERKIPRRRSGKVSPLVVVTLTAVRPNLFDADNSSAGYKPLQDAIAAAIGADDGDRRIHWEYEQITSHGKPKTIVKIEIL